MSSILNKEISFIYKSKDKEKALKEKKKRPYSIIISYDDIINELIMLKEVKKVIFYLNHPTIGQVIIYNKEDWNFLYNFGLIDKCITLKKNKDLALTFDYKIIDNNTKEEETKEKIDNFSKIIKYIIETINIPQSNFFDIFFKFFEPYKDDFKKFFINELIKYKTNSEDLNDHYNNHIYMINSDDLLKSLKQKMLESNNAFNEIMKMLNDEKNEKVCELSNIELQKVKDVKDSEKESLKESDCSNKEIEDSASSIKQNSENSNSVEQKSFIKLSNEEYKKEINELKERFKGEIIIELKKLI